MKGLTDSELRAVAPRLRCAPPLWPLSASAGAPPLWPGGWPAPMPSAGGTAPPPAPAPEEGRIEARRG
eukprot:1044221-Prorocentrum_minimum.AAC.1